MKRLLLCLALAIPLTAAAQVDSWIGLFNNPDAEMTCYADIQVGAPAIVYVMAVIWPSNFPEGITAAEFRVENLPPSGYEHGGIITETWTSDVVVGDLDWDFSIAWSTPQLGDWVLIGQLDFLMLDPSWLGVNHRMTTEPGNTCDCMVLVDHEFVAWDLYINGLFTWNCDDVYCSCIDSVPVQESTWTDVKSLY